MKIPDTIFELNERVPRRKLSPGQLLIIWATALAVVFCVLHPHYRCAAPGTGGKALFAALDEARWIWNPPEDAYWSFSIDHERQAAYLIALLVFGGLSLLTNASISRAKRAKATSPDRTLPTFTAPKTMQGKWPVVPTLIGVFAMAGVSVLILGSSSPTPPASGSEDPAPNIPATTAAPSSKVEFKDGKFVQTSAVDHR